MPPEITEIIKKMLSALTLKEKDQLMGHFLVDSVSILDELEEELGWSIQAEAMEEGLEVE